MITYFFCAIIAALASSTLETERQFSLIFVNDGIFVAAEWPALQTEARWVIIATPSSPHIVADGLLPARAYMLVQADCTANSLAWSASWVYDRGGSIVYSDDQPSSMVPPPDTAMDLVLRYFCGTYEPVTEPGPMSRIVEAINEVWYPHINASVHPTSD